MVLVPVFFIGLVCCYDNFCRCCNRCCKKCDDPQKYLDDKNKINSHNKSRKHQQRIEALVAGYMYNSKEEAEQIIQNFDAKIEKTEKEIDKNNLYVQYKNYKKYHDELIKKHNTNKETVIEPENLYRDEKTTKFDNSIKTIIKDAKRGSDSVYFYKVNNRVGQYIVTATENTFTDIGNSFLKPLEKKNDFDFRWCVDNITFDFGGPSRQLLSSFYQNLLENGTEKLTKKDCQDVTYVVFGSQMTEEDAKILGKLAFLSFFKTSFMEYNLPEVYYKIMLHDSNDKLEDYLTLADFKTMIGIMNATKDGATVEGMNLIPVNIVINQNKDNVFLKYAKEEVYKIYLRLYQEDDVKDFKAFKDNFEEEVAKLMFANLGIKIKDVLEGIMNGFQSYFNNIFEHLEYGCGDIFEEYINSFKPILYKLEYLHETKNAKEVIDLTDADDATKNISCTTFKGKNGNIIIGTTDKNHFETLQKYTENVCLYFSADRTAEENAKSLLALFQQIDISQYNVAYRWYGYEEAIKKAAKNIGNPLPALKEFLKDNKFRPKDFKVFMEGEPVSSVEDLVTHFHVNNDNGLTVEDIKEIVNKKIRGYDKLSKKKFFQKLAHLLTGSSVFYGKVDVYIGDVPNGLAIHTCNKYLTLDQSNPKQYFAKLLDLNQWGYSDFGVR